MEFEFEARIAAGRPCSVSGQVGHVLDRLDRRGLIEDDPAVRVDHVALVLPDVRLDRRDARRLDEAELLAGAARWSLPGQRPSGLDELLPRPRRGRRLEPGGGEEPGVVVEDEGEQMKGRAYSCPLYLFASSTAGK